jgi:hypothetical protein
VTKHLRERLLVGVPKPALLYVVRGELPIVIGEIDAPQEALALLLFREVEEELDDPESVPGQVPLPIVDRFIPTFPDMMFARLGRKLLAEKDFRVHPDDQHLLVVRPVEDADLAARR